MKTKQRIPRIEKADVPSTKGKRDLKKDKNRAERRAAKKDPETVPSYGKYSGWQS